MRAGDAKCETQHGCPAFESPAPEAPNVKAQHEMPVLGMKCWVDV